MGDGTEPERHFWESSRPCENYIGATSTKDISILGKFYRVYAEKKTLGLVGYCHTGTGRLFVPIVLVYIYTIFSVPKQKKKIIYAHNILTRKPFTKIL